MAQAQPTRSSSPALIRAMASTLHDKNVDPLHATAVIVTLVRAGFSARDIEACYDDAILMALIRRKNDGRI